MFSIQGFLTCQSKLPMNYKHLSQVERYQIYALMKAGHDQTQIAKLLDRHKSTISRELSRNRGLKGYRPKQACELTAKRSEQSRNAACVPAWVCEQADGVRIFIGGESQFVPMQELSVVSASYEVDGHVVGTLGVIGPTRMPYERMIQIVDITSKMVGNALSQSK